ncbi:MAG: MATE family efflux transporter [Myxococcaceae bacterium]|jgi:MATE family multidrug resistance protein|nr:MATE family efflux transporter [Myxococcaceae bacterium]MCA3012552.1 MATE family efflux transporter [Myxococcaceae bacterium]
MSAPAAAASRPTLKALLTLAVPVVLSRASQTVVGLSDALMVAHLGAAALAATSTGAANAFSLLILPMGVTFIVSTFAAQLFGRGDVASARRYGWYGLLVAALTQVVSLSALPLVSGVVEALPYEAEVQVLMATYLRWRLVSGGAAIGIEALANFYGGLGRTVPGMVVNLAAMVANVALNALLIDGAGPVPALGVLGAALASSVSTWAAFLGFFAFFLREGRQAARAPLSWAEFTRMVRFGLPAGLNWFFEFLAFIFFVNVVVAGLGTPAVAALNSVIQLNSVAFMPSFAIASAGAVLVGQAIGAGRKDDVPRVVGLSVATASVWMGAAGLAYLLVPELLVRPFARGADGAAVLHFGVRMLTVSAAWQLFDASATSLAECLRGAGDTLYPLVVRLVIAWVVFVPGAYLTVRHLGGGDVEAMAWLVAYLALLAGALFLRFRSGRWREVRLLEPEAP